MREYAEYRFDSRGSQITGATFPGKTKALQPDWRLAINCPVDSALYDHRDVVHWFGTCTGHIAVLTLGKTLHANFRQSRTVYQSRWPSLTEHLQIEPKIVNKHGTADFKMD